MNQRLIPLFSILLLIVILGTLLAACGSSNSASPANSAGSTLGDPTSAGQTLLETRCNLCHSLSRVESAQHTAAEWKVTVDRMISHGAQLTPQEEQTLVAYLAQNYK